MNTRYAVFVGALTMSVLTCCSMGDGGTTATRPSPERSITGFDPSPSHLEASFFALDEVARTKPAELRKAALKHLGDTDPHVHYAAVYALALAATPTEGGAQLAGMLGSASLDDRLLSAASLAGAGDKRGLPVLIEALDQSADLSYRSPPQRCFEFAGAWLIHLTGQDFGLSAARDAAAAAATKPAWQRWWTDHESTLHFDRKKHRYVM